MSVNSNGYIHLGGKIRNIYILLLLSLSFGTVTDIDGNVYETVQIYGTDSDYPTPRKIDIDHNYQLLHSIAISKLLAEQSHRHYHLYR